MTDPLTARIQSGIQTVTQWEEQPPELLTSIRSSLPLTLLSPSRSSSSSAPPNTYTRPNDRRIASLHNDNPDVFLLQRLALYFKMRMTWVNNPPCMHCSSIETVNDGMRGPVTAEEIEGGASRVELYTCKICSLPTTFPRYNSPHAIEKSLRGRCGEYANLFGLYCRSLGYITRYISDFTDHVWIEVYIGGRWIMADSCEGLIDVPHMYEKGWGKKLNVILGFCYLDSRKVEVVDLTRRYTRQWNSPEFKERRKQILGSEHNGELIIERYNSIWKANERDKRWAEWMRRYKEEQSELNQYDRLTEWDDEENVGGRRSGSVAWRIARGEMGREVKEGTVTVSGYELDTIAVGPRDASRLTIHAMCVTPEEVSSNYTLLPHRGCIRLNDTGSAVGEEGLNIVVVDELYGCLLQSKLFKTWEDSTKFLEAVKEGRIVIMVRVGNVPDAREEDMMALQKLLGWTGGSGISITTGYGHNQGSTSFLTASYGRGAAISTTLALCKEKRQWNVDKNDNIRPSSIYCRLPDSILPLSQQLTASWIDKKRAFEEYAKKDSSVLGFTSRDSYPILLMSSRAAPAFPLRYDDGWVTYHYVPSALLPPEEEDTAPPLLEIPVDIPYFQNLLGSHLLAPSSLSSIPLAATLSQTRLIALYFSEHWCPPCRRFTPLLIECYHTIKQERPNTLEVIYVSSERDDSVFRDYFGSMPWYALPREGGRSDMLKMQYAVRGIPHLVILDSLTGSVIEGEMRSEVMMAVRNGDEGVVGLVESWLKRIPMESQVIMESMELSCQVDPEIELRKKQEARDAYLVRAETDTIKAVPTLAPIDPQMRLKQLFSVLIAEGKTPNEAAAEAIQRLAVEQQQQQSNNTAPRLLSPDPNTLPPHTLTLPSQTIPMEVKSDTSPGVYCFTDDESCNMPLTFLSLIRQSSSSIITGIQSMTDNGANKARHIHPENNIEENDEAIETISLGSDVKRLEGVISPHDGGVGLSSITVIHHSDNDEVQSSSDMICWEIPKGYHIVGCHGRLLSSKVLSLGFICTNNTTESTCTPPSNLPPSQEQTTAVVTLAQKYLQNVITNPSQPKYRAVKLSNKIFDRIASIPGGVDLLLDVGFCWSVVGGEFLMRIPLGRDLVKMREKLDELLKKDA